ncbi:MAG: D-alanyl-D-alanine carboxypeptidase family protein [Bacillota bacterium]|nr:D-alanyl-D-alanine carboxypeptidase family protein [Bacillota bacterium]MDP4155368.1 D-alanyl-D-alanine carboxypeptidase family protein [Bacillota bacterium]
MRMVSVLFIFVLIMGIYMANLPQKVNASVSVSAKSAILMEQKSGRILYEKDAFTKRRIASITKIMTATLAIESGKMDKYVTVSENAVHTEGSSIYLKAGEKIKLKDLVYGLMLRSGNDAAVAIAEFVGGSVDGFVFLMNQKAKEIGMLNTHFANPHGLDDSKDHYSTAYDMAVLTRYAMNNKQYREIAGTKVYRAPNPGENWDRVWKNKNRLLTKYQYCTGGKTGYTKLAKRTLVTTAEKGDMDLIAVTINDSKDWDDHIAMYENGFKGYDMTEVLPQGKIDLGTKSKYNGQLYLRNSLVYPATSEEMKNFRVNYKIAAYSSKQKSGPVGKAQVFLDGKLIREMPIYYQKKSEKESKSGLMDFFNHTFLTILGVKTNG